MDFGSRHTNVLRNGVASPNVFNIPTDTASSVSETIRFDYGGDTFQFLLEKLAGANSISAFTISQVVVLPATITVAGTGDGNGFTSFTNLISTVCLTDAGVNTNNCSETVNAGDVVIMTASADAGTTVTGWSGCDAVSSNIFPNDTCTQTLEADETVQPNFALTGSPGISISGNAVVIAPDGSDSSSLLNDTVFGNADIGGTSVEKTFTIANTGTGYLSLVGAPIVNITGTNAADFSVTQNPIGPVASGSPTSFTITFNPAAAGNRTAQVQVRSIPPDSTYYINISGTGIANHVLTIATSGNGEGAVQSSEVVPVLNCVRSAGVESGTCSESFEDNVAVRLFAGPPQGSNFTGWDN